MTVNALKRKVIDQIQHLEDMDKLEAIDQILNKENPYVLSSQQIEGIEEGILDYSNGDFLSQEEMLNEDEEKEWMQP